MNDELCDCDPSALNAWRTRYPFYCITSEVKSCPVSDDRVVSILEQIELKLDAILKEMRGGD